jgi:hypothetical protein
VFSTGVGRPELVPGENIKITLKEKNEKSNCVAIFQTTLGRVHLFWEVYFALFDDFSGSTSSSI